MQQPETPELASFLAAHPRMRFIDAFLADLNTVERGKRIDRGSATALYAEGLALPGSMYALDVQGGTIQASGLGFADGDADRRCLPIPDTLVPIPWLAEDVAQVQLAMYEQDGTPFFGDPRHALSAVLDRCRAAGLTPVIAVELEFYFVDRERTADGLPQPPPGPLTGRREQRTQINSMTDLTEYSPLLAAIDAAARRQRIPVTSALPEYGPGQYEINLAHGPDALRACDEALRFKRAVKGVARARGCDATFLPKPYRDMAGSGLHVHASLLDRNGRNIFESDDPQLSASLRHAITGVLDAMAEGTAICAPGPNSYRRFQNESYAPLIPAWSINNRGTAVRVPASDPANRRIEHRQAGADANPYLVVAWLLASMLEGLERAIEPPPPVKGNAYAVRGAPLPRHWASALHAFESGERAHAYLGAPFANLYAAVKRGELEAFDSYVTPLECAWYLGPL